METKLQHPLLGEIVLCQTRRARRISLSVRSTGGVRLSFPCNVPRARALAFLESKTDWVIRYGRVTIRASRTKWGCCTGDNNLSLSLFLMTLPPHLRDFVLLHELCHTVHHDHSPHFHALLDRLTGGNEKLLSRELRSYSIPAR